MLVEVKTVESIKSRNGFLEYLKNIIGNNLSI
jgi:hypothetical protein